ncbi:putative Fe-S center protein [Methanolinea mesophila]|uniref:DUF362 domain-containing protein n=1 Tax=Methanolinea mesophila TaxID=547055 RepID=UPI001AE510A0|nr:DUF362 domain-containing protein [Methanolinea mesophila]MBP1929376.1 putative Fe-S center protein [Methanolinea mesophila]
MSERFGDAPSEVFFADIRARAPGENTIGQIRNLFDRAGFPAVIANSAPTAIKLHFGEWGNDSYINPVFVRQVVDKVKQSGGRPFLTDSNTLYRGSRSNAVDHLITAIEHGFCYSVAGAPLIIADGLTGKNHRRVRVEGNHFTSVLISADIAEAPSMVVLSHFKGHEVAGFGGAIKNLAMGCAPRAGKQHQHSARPMNVEGHCVGCGRCIAVCPRHAIDLDAGVSRIRTEDCIGCFECMTVCPEDAIDVDWTTEIPLFIERMVEYALGAVHNKTGRLGFMNFLIDITPDCDCVPWSDAAIVPDIGILASRDPVAIDAASFDLVNASRGIEGPYLSRNLEEGADKFRGMRAQTDACRQIAYAEKLGLGSSDYRLVRL